MRIAILTSGIKDIPGPKDSIYAPGKNINNLVNGLVERGHDVSLYAAKGSKTLANLKSFEVSSTYGTYKELQASDPAFFQTMQARTDLYLVNRLLADHKEKPYDIIHAHDYRNVMFLSKQFGIPILITHRGNPANSIKEPIDKKIFEFFFDSCRFIGISQNQFKSEEVRKYLNLIGVVYNSIDPNFFSFNPNPGNHLLFAGRLLQIKGPDLAIKAALAADCDIKLAGEGSGEYVENELMIYKDNPRVEFLGHVSYQNMPKVYGDAKALLFPLVHEEPFGMVFVEAMACGTPVIAFDRGPVRELIKDGETGIIVREETPEALARAIGEIDKIDREKCRKHVLENFVVEKMVEGYEGIYQKLRREIEG